jgi:1-acyl-sn-glycerol-3-phosphate acyltransferase
MHQQRWYYLGRSLVAAYTQYILKADIQYKATLPDGPKILVANHPSTSDPAFVTVLLEEQISILIKELLFKVPLFGRSLRWSGHIPVVEGEGKQAMQSAVEYLRAGRSIFVFPEGEISPLEGGFRRAHSGAARLALSTGAPVIPVGLGLVPGRLREIPAIVDGKLDVGYWYLHGPYAMTVGRPLFFQGDSSNQTHVHEVIDQIMHQVSLLAADSYSRARAAQPAALGVGSVVSLGWQLFGRLFYQLSTI